MKHELPDGWERKKLGDIGEICSGGTPSTKDETYYNGDVPWITPADLSNFEDIYIERGKRNITEKGLTNSSARLLPEDSIIFSTRAPIGYVAIAANPLATNQGFKNIILKGGFFPKYVYYYLKSNTKLMDKYASGTTFLEVSGKRFFQVPILIPPFETQHKIVAILEKAEETKKLRVQADELSQQLLQSVFLEIFGDPLKNENGWKLKELQDVCIKITDGTHHSPFNTEEGDIPYITAKNITKNGFDFRKLTYISKEVHEEIYKRCNPEIGDVLYIKDGVTTGIALVNTLEYEFSLLSSVALLKPSKDLNPYYLSHLLNLDIMYKKIRSNMGGAAITRLTIIKIKKIKIPIPPIELQNKFAKISQQVEKTTQAQKETSQELKSLFNTLTQKAFTGELVS